MKRITLSFATIAETAGFVAEAPGKFNLPANQDSADRLAKAAADLMGEWQPGDECIAVTLTGPGPVWGYLAIAHALHGRCVQLDYAAPNAAITVFQHGV